MNNPGPVFNSYSRYYDLLYRDKDYVAEVAYIDCLLKKQGVAGKEILEFGSGTGKHARLLAQRGYRVHGIERSTGMCAQAETVDGFTCQQGDISTVHLGRTFDAVLALFHVVSYQVTNAAVSDLFARASEHLKPGGLFAFDAWYTPAVYAERPTVRVKRVADEDLEITRIAEPVFLPNENRVDVKYTVFARDLKTGLTQTFNETHPMRHFSLPEFDLLASIHGFQRVVAEEFITSRGPSDDTWGACVVLRKR